MRIRKVHGQSEGDRGCTADGGPIHSNPEIRPGHLLAAMLVKKTGPSLNCEAFGCAW